MTTIRDLYVFRSPDRVDTLSSQVVSSLDYLSVLLRHRSELYLVPSSLFSVDRILIVPYTPSSPPSKDLLLCKVDLKLLRIPRYSICSFFPVRSSLFYSSPYPLHCVVPHTVPVPQSYTGVGTHSWYRSLFPVSPRGLQLGNTFTVGEKRYQCRRGGRCTVGRPTGDIDPNENSLSQVKDMGLGFGTLVDLLVFRPQSVDLFTRLFP